MASEEESALKLLKRMLDPEDLGWSVSEEVRKEIRKLLFSKDNDESKDR